MRTGNRPQTVCQRNGAGHACAESDAIIRPARHYPLSSGWQRFSRLPDKDAHITQSVISANGNQIINAEEIEIL